jgi:hypothetical protein
MVQFKELTTLQKWIVERKVGRNDEISLTGETWKRLGDIPELATFFEIVEQAKRAEMLAATGPDPFGTGERGQQKGRGAPPGPPLLGELPRGPGRGAVPGSADEAPPPRALGGGRLGPDLQEEARPPVKGPGMSFDLSGGASTGAEPAFARKTLGMGRPSAPMPPYARKGRGGWVVLGVLLGTGAFVALHEGVRSQLLSWLSQMAPGLAAERSTFDDLDAGVAEALDAGAPVVEAPKVVEKPEVDAGRAAPPVAEPKAEAPEPKKAEVPEKAPGDLQAAFREAGAPGTDSAGTRGFDAVLRRADALRLRGRHDAALDAYAKAAELDPERPEPLVGKALVLFDRGLHAQAEVAFLQALSIDRQHGNALMGLAETYRALGKRAEAIQYYEKYLETSPQGSDVEAARSALEQLKGEEGSP